VTTSITVHDLHKSPGAKVQVTGRSTAGATWIEFAFGDTDLTVFVRDADELDLLIAKLSAQLAALVRPFPRIYPDEP